MADREQGTFTCFNKTRGYGFIRADAGGDLFCHITNIREPVPLFILVGQRAEYEVKKTKKGLIATVVQLIEGKSS